LNTYFLHFVVAVGSVRYSEWPCTIAPLFQTTTELRQKYSEYLDQHGYNQSILSTSAFDAIWAAAKALNASIERLQPNETIDQFTYDNNRMTKIFFNSLTNLQFEGASVSYDR